MTSRLLLFFAMTISCQLANARPVLDCKMKANPCTMSGASLTLPWENIPDPAHYAYRQQFTGDFEVLYGYEQATGDFAQGRLIIRDQDPQLGPYWGFVPENETTYFAMISGSMATGFRMGVKGCAASPRVWSSSCRLTTEDELQAEMFRAAGVGTSPAPVVEAEVQSSSAPSKCFIRVDAPYLYYILETNGQEAYLSMKYFNGGGDGYTFQAFENPRRNVTLYKDKYFGLNMSVETQGNIKVVSVSGGPTFDAKICRAELDMTGLRAPTENEAR